MAVVGTSSAERVLSMVSQGMGLPLVQFLGRWDSNVIRNYIADAPAEIVTDEHKIKLMQQSLGDLRMTAAGQIYTPAYHDEGIKEIEQRIATICTDNKQDELRKLTDITIERVGDFEL